MIDQDAAYLHLTGNNTLYGSRWQTFPETGVLQFRRWNYLEQFDIG
jgi:phosphoserine aminotransferase